MPVQLRLVSEKMSGGIQQILEWRKTINLNANRTNKSSNLSILIIGLTNRIGCHNHLQRLIHQERISVLALSRINKPLKPMKELGQVKDDPKHRRVMFKIWCKILGKLCKVIADLVSIDNIISKEAIKKIKSAKIPHVNPYKVTWLNKRHSVLVNE